VKDKLIKLMLCSTKKMTSDDLTKSLLYPSFRTHIKTMLNVTRNKRCYRPHHVVPVPAGHGQKKRCHMMVEPLNVSEDRGVSYIHLCICKGGGHTECASDAVDRLGSVETSKCVGAP